MRKRIRRTLTQIGRDLAVAEKVENRENTGFEIGETVQFFWPRNWGLYCGVVQAIKREEIKISFAYGNRWIEARHVRKLGEK